MQLINNAYSGTYGIVATPMKIYINVGKLNEIESNIP